MKGSKLDMPMKYRHFLKVTIKPFFQFPLDMLRYDRCCPFQEIDAAAIRETLAFPTTHDQSIIVILMGYSESQSPRWTIERWAGDHVMIESISEADVPAARGAVPAA